MSLSVTQIVSASYNAVLNAARKPENQWAESAFMRELERQGAIEHVDFGPNIEATLDWRRNAGAGFQASELEAQSLAKTDILTSAVYAIAELTVPMVWTYKDEASNPSQNQKVKLSESIITNALASHDDVAEEAIFATSTNGFLGLLTIVPDSGQGTVGGIDASTETMWRNTVTAYTGASDVEASLTTNWNAVAKGSGSGLTPKFIISGSVPHAQFESTQQALQRYVDGKEADAGFKILAFKTARYSFSQYGGTRIYLLNPKSFGLKVSKSHFRKKGETQDIVGKSGYYTSVYSAMQLVTNNKSRCGLVKI